MEKTQRDGEYFLNVISKNYDIMKGRLRKMCSEQNLPWSEDIFSDTILQCHKAIEKKGKINDKTENGCLNYFFRSFRQNIVRERQYSRIKNRDFNITDEQLNEKYEDFNDRFVLSGNEKLKQDITKDYFAISLIKKAEEHFPAEDVYLFKLKYLLSKSFKEIARQTGRKGTRDKIIEIRNWLQENVTKEQLEEQLFLDYGEILEE